MKKFIPLLSISLFLLMAFKPPKNPSYPKNDILYQKYGGDVDKMMREERKLDSLAHPYLYTVEEKKDTAVSGVDDETVILEKAEVMPQFPDGDKGMKEYIASATAFIPDTLIGKKANVLVKFYINTLGDAKNPVIVKTDDHSFDLQTLMVVDGMPKWTPGKQNGKEVNCYITLPLKYGQ